MRVNRIPLTIVICILFIGCQKDEEIPITYSSIYHKTEVKAVWGAKVFSSNGEIKDRSVIRRIVRNFNLASPGEIEAVRLPGSLDSVIFIDAQQAVLNHSFFNWHCTVSTQSPYIVLTTNDTIEGYSESNELSQTVRYHLGQFKPEIFTEYIISSTRGGYLFGYKAKTRYVLTQAKNKLSAPIIFYKHQRNSWFYGSGYINNILQKDFYKNLSAGDTVALQEMAIMYEK
jgi:hypothetical protein